jgi:GAF domain-containing protein
MEDKKQFYKDLAAGAKALLSGERDPIANASNFSALVFNGISGLNWAGFYFIKGDELLLGPFQGKPACVRLKKPRGVCWAAVLEAKTVTVADVHAFAGHIACDAASVSEIVVPVVKNGGVIGVFDADSPLPSRFEDETDKEGFENLVRIFENSTDLQGQRI